MQLVGVLELIHHDQLELVLIGPGDFRVGSQRLVGHDQQVILIHPIRPFQLNKDVLKCPGESDQALLSHIGATGPRLGGNLGIRT